MPSFFNEAYPVAVTDMDMSEVRDLFEVNLFAPMILVQEFIHLLIASGDGRIMHTGSISGIMPVPFSAAYNASKAALHSFNNTLRVELAPFKSVLRCIHHRPALAEDDIFNAQRQSHQCREPSAFSSSFKNNLV